MNYEKEKGDLPKDKKKELGKNWWAGDPRIPKTYTPSKEFVEGLTPEARRVYDSWAEVEKINIGILAGLGFASLEAAYEARINGALKMEEERKARRAEAREIAKSREGSGKEIEIVELTDSE